MHSIWGCSCLRSDYLLSCKHVYQVFIRNSTYILFCHALSAVEHKYAKTNLIFEYLSVFFHCNLNFKQSYVCMILILRVMSATN